jgi:hypothetical protein
MYSIKLNMIMQCLCSTFLLLFMVLGSTVSAHAFAGAISSAELTNIVFNDPNVTPSLITYESTGISTTPYDYSISNSGTSLITDPYNSSTTTVSSSLTSVNQNAIVSANLLGSFQADTQSLLNIFFQVNGTGFVTASADFSLLLQAFADNTAIESASGFSSASIYLFNTTQSTADFSASQGLSFYTSATSLDYLDSLSGLLATSLQFNTGDYGLVSFIVEGNATASSVPEPSTFALFGIGLAGAALLRKRSRV